MAQATRTAKPGPVDQGHTLTDQSWPDRNRRFTFAERRQLMKKRIEWALVLAVLAVLLLGCAGNTRIVHCDGCGKEISVPEDSDTDESWIILCEDCKKKLYSEP